MGTAFSGKRGRAVEEAIQGFLRHLSEEKHFSENTIVAYNNDLEQLLTFLRSRASEEGLGWRAADRDLMLAYLLHLNEQDYALATRARKTAAARSFFKFLTQRGTIGANPTQGLRFPKVRKAMPKSLTAQEVAALLQQPARGTGPEAKRDGAMLELLYATGMRVTELVSMDVGDFYPEAGLVRCRGRAARERALPLAPDVIANLEQYVAEARPRWQRDSNQEALFLNRRGQRLTRQGFWLILKGYARQAQLRGKITPYTLRHSFAAHMLSNGAGLKAVKELLGHSNLATTQIYAQFVASGSPMSEERAQD